MSENAVFFATGGGYVVSRDRANGELQWSTQIGASPHSVSANIGGQNFVLSNGVLVTAVQFHTSGLDAASGTELWRYHAPVDTMYKPEPRPGYVEKVRIAADENTVYIPAWGASISAVNLQTGIAKWVWRVEPTLAHRSGSMGVSLSGDTLFATVWHALDSLGAKAEAWLLALDKKTGKEFWRVILPRQTAGVVAVQSAPAFWRDLVFVSMASGDLFAVDRTTRQIAWHIPTHIPPSGLGVALLTSAEVYGDIVYCLGSDEKLRAFRPADGTEIWEAQATQLSNDLLVTEKYVYGSHGSLYIFDRRTGERYAAISRHPRGAHDLLFSSSAAVHNGQIFVTLTDGAWSFDEP